VYSNGTGKSSHVRKLGRALIVPETTLPSHRNDNRVKEQERDERYLHHGGVPGRSRVRFLPSKFRVTFFSGVRFPIEDWILRVARGPQVMQKDSTNDAIQTAF
jgi:hypothetical protein